MSRSARSARRRARRNANANDDRVCWSSSDGSNCCCCSDLSKSDNDDEDVNHGMVNIGFLYMSGSEACPPLHLQFSRDHSIGLAVAHLRRYSPAMEVRAIKIFIGTTQCCDYDRLFTTQAASAQLDKSPGELVLTVLLVPVKPPPLEHLVLA